MKKIFSMSLLMGLMMFISCDEINTTYLSLSPYYAVPTYVAPGTANDQGQYAIAFYSYSNGQTRAAVNSNSQTGYDDFTLYSWTKDSVVMDKYHAQWVNNGWTYVGVDGQQLKYFDNFVNEYNFIGVIPQTTASINNGVVTTSVEGFKVDNEAQTDTPNEFLYATTTVAKANYVGGITMNFNHGNAKVYLAFTSDDSNTQVMDYIPGTSIEYVYYANATAQISAGNDVTALNITQAEIDEINDNYGWELVDAQKDWYYDLTTDALGALKKKTSITKSIYDAIVEKWPSLATSANDAGLNFAPYYNGGNYTPIRMDVVDGGTAINASVAGAVNDGKKYLVVWAVRNTSLATSETKVDHINNVPGVIILPATSVAEDGSDAVLATYPTKADVDVSLNGLSWTTTEEDNSVTFTTPSTNITSNDTNAPIYSPTTWYTLPCNAANVGYTIKVSYNYKGVNVYDARVFIPSADCQWQEGKYYLYVIKINGKGNGHVDPNDPSATDPTVEAINRNEIQLFLVTFSDYELGKTVIKAIY